MAAPRQAGRLAPTSAQSHSYPLNPKAQNFSFGEDSNQASSSALVRYDSADDGIHNQSLAQQFQNLAVTYGDEILSLRKDVERLKQGGLTVTFGNQQLRGTLDSSELEATRKRLESTHKSLNAPINSEELPSSLLKAIEAAPEGMHGASDSPGTKIASPKFSPQNTAPGDKGRTPSGGLSLSRYAPKASIAPNKTTQPVSAQSNGSKPNNAHTNGSSNGVQASVNKQNRKPDTIQANGTQTVANKSNGTQSPQVASKIQVIMTERPPSQSVKFEDGATKDPGSNDHGNQAAQPTPIDVETQPTTAEAPVLESVKSDAEANKVPEHSQHEHPDNAVPTTEDPSAAFIKRSPNWQPLGVRRLAPLSPDHLQGIPAASDTITFSWDFIRDLFGGKQWSPGFYYKETKAGSSILRSRSYYVLDPALDPYLPKTPGMHGAKLTAFFNPENPDDIDGEDGAKAFERVPLFMATTPVAVDASKKGDRRGKQYQYFGMYSQPRYSDKLDYDRMIEVVPHHVKMHWATVLADPSRPPWVTAMLKAHVGDKVKPEYDGPMPDGTAAGCDPAEFKAEVFNWVGQLKAWSKRATKHVGRLSKEAVLAAFEREDTACPPGLRLWWEYLACDGWDAGFYGMLVHEQAKFERRRAGDPRFTQHSVDRSALDMIEEFPTS